MKIAVVGCGAMGSLYAALLASAGNEVWAIDVDAAHVNAIRSGGLQVSGASGERTVQLNATIDPSEPGACALVVIATKAMHVAAAAASARPLVGPDTVVLTIQNGLGSAETVLAALDGAHVTIGVAGGFGAEFRGPGRVHHNGWELVRLGEPEGPVTSALDAVAGVWRAAGFRVQAYDDIQRMVWEKLICNVCFSGTCALTELTIGEVMETPEAWRVALECALEAHAVAQARGVRLGFEDPVAYVTTFGRTIPNARPSMLLDHLARRRAEVDAINGAIPPAARTCGLNAPVNEVVVALLKAKESRFQAAPLAADGA